MTTANHLGSHRCKPCAEDTAPMKDDVAKANLSALPGWESDGKVIRKKFSFGNFYETMSFVNAVAWIANRQDHHPDLQVSYRNCIVQYTTHKIGGLSENDFICAAKIEALLKEDKEEGA